MEAGALFHTLHREPKLMFTFAQIINIGMKLASAGFFLHKILNPPIIHRDITSHNILLKSRPRYFDTDVDVKLSDFGISRQKLGRGLEIMSPVGNPRWTAPEIIRKEPYCKKVDVWSFGEKKKKVFST
jgi:serine/threonine protein kinase